MRISRRALAGAAALAVAAGSAVWAQQSPQSILPPGFGDPAPPPPAAVAPPTSAPAQPAPPGISAPAGAGSVPTIALAPPDAQQIADAEAAAQEAADALRRQDIPTFARRATDHVGILSNAVTGIPEDGFGNEAGGYLTTLIARLDAPIASRWASMLLRRVLTTDIATPRGVDPADWTAERAALLARMGEADAARLTVQQIDPDRATPRVWAATYTAALAAADPAALCPVADAAETATRRTAWTLARAMCAGLSNDGGNASALIDRARASGRPPGALDLQLAERVIGAGTAAKRAPQIRWSSVNALDPWRFGLGSAIGLEIPASLLDGGGLAMQAWRARAPMLPLTGRLPALRTAATLGVVSAAGLVDAYASAADEADQPPAADTPAARLRLAFSAAEERDRVAALRALWADPVDERDLYAGRVLGARPAALLAPSSDYASDAAALIAAMLSAGMDRRAARWAPVAARARGTAGEEARALIAVGVPEAPAFDPDQIAGFGDGGRGSARLRAQFLFAGLAGLGRIDARRVDPLARELGVPIGARNAWTRAIDGAVARGEPATVALLAAVGMQTTDWTQVSPAFLYHVVAGLRGVGFEPEARMIAAEALMRT